ncbi:Lactonase, 7-bladed beta-propeller-domain-containing protein [Nemania abortiva]|nr:Lactonase, 7-bladed beta-propeller-domain-containing protein [Nemania abortiva]
MLPQALTAFLALGGMAAAAPRPMARDAKTYNLFVGGPGQVMIATFDGSNFNITNTHAEPGAAPSWMTYKHSTGALYVNNEYSTDLNVLNLKPDGPAVAATVNGSNGVVFFEFNKDQTRMVGAGYASGAVDIWDTSAAEPKLMKSVNITGPLAPNQIIHHPHQAILDPSGRFMVIPDLGGDQLLVMRIENDTFAITNSVSLSKGFGPRHGSFIGGNNGKLYFLVACELSNIVVLYEADYTDNEGIAFKWISEQSTYGTGAPKNTTSAAAGAVLVASNQKDVYISNRLTGDDTDNVAHFVFDPASTNLTYHESISTSGQQPRSMAFSATKEQEVLFVANQAGKNGLAAFSRDGTTGKLSADPVGVMAYEKLAPKGDNAPALGPQFVSVYLT